MDSRTPEALSTHDDNNLICEKLLGWRKVYPTSPLPGIEFVCWCDDQGRDRNTPSFTTWAEAGLILDELNRRKIEVDINLEAGQCWVTLWTPKPRSTAKSENVPSLVRAAVLEYIRSLP